jgi:hypothetical protein
MDRLRIMQIFEFLRVRVILDEFAYIVDKLVGYVYRI